MRPTDTRATAGADPRLVLDVGDTVPAWGNKPTVSTMNLPLWILQVLAALLYGSSGVIKVLMFEKISRDVPSFGALPRQAWMALGILELICVIGLIVLAAVHRQPELTIVAVTTRPARLWLARG